MTEKQLVDMYRTVRQPKFRLFGLKFGSIDREYLMYGDTYLRLMATMKRLCAKVEQTLDNSIGGILEVTQYEIGHVTVSTKKSRWELCRINDRLCWLRL